MSFGKDPAQLALVQSFRQSTGPALQPRARSPRGSGIPQFVGQYQPAVGVPSVIRLLNASFVQQQVVKQGDEQVVVAVTRPFIEYTEHFSGGKGKGRGSICSAGPWAFDKNKRSPCLACDVYWATAERTAEGMRSNTISRQRKFAIDVFDYSFHHKVDRRDASGNLVINKTTKAPYFNWVRCEGQGCENCRVPGLEGRVGDSRHWSINQTNFEVLRDAELSIGQSCVVCSNVNSIKSYGFICGGCQNTVIDPETSTLKNEEIKKLTGAPYTCRCGFEGMLQELTECVTCAANGQVGARASLFDVDIQVQGLRAGDRNFLQVMAWSTPGPMRPEFAALAEPIDLIDRYKPDTMEQQQQKFGHLASLVSTPAAAPLPVQPNPYAPTAPAPATARPYAPPAPSAAPFPWSKPTQ